MDEEQKRQYNEKYAKAKQKGVKFWPDIIYKDLIVSFGIFLLLVGLATFIGVAQEPKADPSDSAYIPRPEWYFMFLFQMLKYFPGKLEWVGTTIIPTLAVLALFLLPFYDRSPYRYWKKRLFAIGFMSVVVIGMAGLTIRAFATTPPQEETGTVAATVAEQVIAGQDLFSVQCTECHGPEGQGGEIKGVEGLEGVILKPISSKDEMYTREDQTFANIIAYGQPDLGMPPFGRAFGGELSPGDIEAIVAFMRYTWDDRVQLPAEAAAASAIPTLAPGQVPSYEVFIAPITKRYCISCHRPGKKNNNFLMQSYEEIMTTGDNTPNIIPGDLNSNLIRMINREDLGDIGGPMPPTSALKDAYIQIFEQWVLAGAPNTADDAAAASASGGATPAATEMPTPTP